MSGKMLKCQYLVLLSFVGGLMIMAWEMVAFRVVAVELGSSVVVTGSLLTMVMLALASGYFIGGYLSRRRFGIEFLLVLLFLASVYLLVTNVWFLDPISAFIVDENRENSSSGVLTSLVVTAFWGGPMVVLSMISPFLIADKTSEISNIGKAGYTAGIFMSISTTGSIVGTIVASYWLIPNFGVRTGGLYLGFVFSTYILVGLILFSKRFVFVIGLIVMAILIGLIKSFSFDSVNENLVFERETQYGSIRLYEFIDDDGYRYLEYRPSKVYTHSVLYPDEPLRDIIGLQYIAPFSIRKPDSVLVLGSAAGGIIRQINELDDTVRILGVELDPDVSKMARDVFDVKGESIELVDLDARVFLESSDEVFDYIIMDLFSGEFIPSHCITVEFFRLLRSRLSKNGMVFINTNMSDLPIEDGGVAFRAIRHLEETLRRSGFPTIVANQFYPSLYVFQEELEFEVVRDELLQGVESLDDVNEYFKAAVRLAALYSVPVDVGGERYRIFTDDWAPAHLIEKRTNSAEILSSVSDKKSQQVAGELNEILVTGLIEDARSTKRKSNLLDGKINNVNLLIRRCSESNVAVNHQNLHMIPKYIRFRWTIGTISAEFEGGLAEILSLYFELNNAGHSNDLDKLLRVSDKIIRKIW